MKRVLITGASGFIGNALVAAAPEIEVIFASRHPSVLPGHILMDLNQPQQVLDVLMGTRPDTIIHLAWQGIPDFSESMNTINLQQGHHLVQAALRSGCERLVMTGSCMEYRGLQGCVNEEQFSDEPDALARVKLQLLEQTRQCWPHQLLWLRPFYVYGHGQRAAALIPSLLSGLKKGEVPVLSGSSQAHDFIDVGGVAEAVWRLLANDKAEGVFNLGTGQLRLVDEIKSWVTALWFDQPLCTLPQLPLGFYADTARLKSATSWVPPDKMKQTLRKLVTDAKQA